MRVILEKVPAIRGKAIVITDVKDRKVRDKLEEFTGDAKLVHQIP